MNTYNKYKVRKGNRTNSSTKDQSGCKHLSSLNVHDLDFKRN